MENSSLEQVLQDAKLHRQVNSLIVAHLRDNNLYQAASFVASATMTSLRMKKPRLISSLNWLPRFVFAFQGLFSPCVLVLFFIV
ncbi:cleavage stimulation factor subunit 50 isoform X2 [Prunus yedoensis var. nudiflora]|uniref:Cleavage stimulation factor subunit 50 isoform X2 n=1 Tax=Prunus yedoensis var. nudiflora TaxID=2094558 RepID=A0A314YWB3_PRUYE|nr:cleavage stimulation factor subunit 50 isoform X2 [Prunus yedoensis var. nudiflora]